MTYQIDPKHSSARFKVRHMMIANVQGTFDSVSGTVELDSAKPDSARLDATIDVNSLHTGDPQRDGHLAVALARLFDRRAHVSDHARSRGDALHVIGRGSAAASDQVDKPGPGELAQQR